MVLSNAKETITTVVVNPDTKEEETKVSYYKVAINIFERSQIATAELFSSEETR